MPIANIIHHSNKIYNYFKVLNLNCFLSDIYLQHFMAIILSTFLAWIPWQNNGFRLEPANMHRTIVAHFLNQGKWNDFLFQDALRNSVAYLIYREATISGQPIFCIVDDTIASHTKLSSQALHPIEAAYFHQSHLKRQTGLWAPDCVRHAFVQWNHSELCRYSV